MSLLKVYGRTSSINVAKVLWCCDELGVKYEQIDAGAGFALNKDNPEYRKLNPNGLIPTIDDNGFVLWESNSIVKYVWRKYSKETMTVEEEAKVDQWMDFSHSIWEPMRILWIGFMRTAKEQRDMVKIEKAIVEAGELYSILNGHMKNNTYVVGDNFTIADMALAGWFYRFKSLPINKPDLRNLEEYLEKIAEKESFVKWFMTPTPEEIVKIASQ